MVLFPLVFLSFNPQAGPDESLKDVAFRIMQNKISTVPVLHAAEGGSCPNLLHIACLAGILKRGLCQIIWRTFLSRIYLRIFLVVM